MGLRYLTVLGAPAFTPASLSGLFGWCDASNSGSITKDGSNKVSQINDLSGANKHFSQATGGEQPTWLSADQNGKDTLQFNGSNLANAYGSTISTFTFWAALKPTTQATFDALVSSPTATTGGITLENGPGTLLNCWIENVGAVAAGSSGTYPNNTAQTVFLTYTSGDLQIFVNNSQTGTSSTASRFLNTPITIGDDDRGAFGSFRGKFFEWGFNTVVISSGERASLQSYLGAKWGF